MEGGKDGKPSFESQDLSWESCTTFCKTLDLLSVNLVSSSVKRNSSQHPPHGAHGRIK